MICYVNEFKDRNHTHFDRYRKILLTKSHMTSYQNPEVTQNRRNISQHKKAKYEKPIANIILIMEKFTAFSLK